jgi:hypothetical protein
MMDYGKPDNLLRKNVKNQKLKVIEVLVEPYCLGGMESIQRALTNPRRIGIVN